VQVVEFVLRSQTLEAQQSGAIPDRNRSSSFRYWLSGVGIYGIVLVGEVWQTDDLITGLLYNTASSKIKRSNDFALSQPDNFFSHLTIERGVECIRSLWVVKNGGVILQRHPPCRLLVLCWRAVGYAPLAEVLLKAVQCCVGLVTPGVVRFDSYSIPGWAGVGTTCAELLLARQQGTMRLGVRSAPGSSLLLVVQHGDCRGGSLKMLGLGFTCEDIVLVANQCGRITNRVDWSLLAYAGHS